MPSITTWWRLESTVTQPDSDDGYAARVHDPLWLLGRQWQVGEFSGQDGGSPAQARWRALVAPMTRYQPGPIPPDTQLQAGALDGTLPWQVIAERRPLGAPGVRDGVESGLQFLRLLREQPTTADHSNLIRSAYPGPAPTPEERAALDSDALAYLELVAGRALDGRRLRAALGDASDPHLDPALGLPAGDVAEVLEACRAWMHQQDSLCAVPPDGGRTWQQDRLEYAFSMATRMGSDAFAERTLTAENFANGTLDWYSFDLNEAINMGTGSDAPAAVVTRTAVPAPVTFRGMPSTRFWQFEDARLDLGSLQPGATDLAQLLTVEALTGFGNDWFVLPVRLPVGTLAQARSLVVTDSFGVSTLLRPTGDPALGSGAGWSMYALAMPLDPSDPVGVPATNLFLLAPTLLHPLEGPVLEEVSMVRDELANLAWAIERRLPNELGAGVETSRTATDLAAEAGGPAVVGPSYRLTGAVPEHWIPLIPTLTSPDTGEVRLAVGRVLDLDGTPHVVMAAAPLLQAAAAGQPVLLREEEVPREGVLVRRSYRSARGPAGRRLGWSAYTTTVGRGELSSGLAFDHLDGDLTQPAP